MGAAFSGVGISYVYEGMVVVDSQLFDRGHMIRRWADGVARNYERFVVEEAPLNKRPNKSIGVPGELKAGLHTFVERVGVKHLVTSVYSLAPYTKYVAGGTGEIFPKNGAYMKLPINPGFPSGRGNGFYTVHRSVSGQARNQFFERAFVRTAARHPSLRGGLSSPLAFRLPG